MVDNSLYFHTEHRVLTWFSVMEFISILRKIVTSNNFYEIYRSIYFRLVYVTYFSLIHIRIRFLIDRFTSFVISGNKSINDHGYLLVEKGLGRESPAQGEELGTRIPS